MYISVDEPTRSVRAAAGLSALIASGEGHTVGHDDDTAQCPLGGTGSRALRRPGRWLPLVGPGLQHGGRHS